MKTRFTPRCESLEGRCLLAAAPLGPVIPDGYMAPQVDSPADYFLPALPSVSVSVERRELCNVLICHFHSPQSWLVAMPGGEGEWTDRSGIVRLTLPSDLRTVRISLLDSSAAPAAVLRVDLTADGSTILQQQWESAESRFTWPVSASSEQLLVTGLGMGVMNAPANSGLVASSTTLNHQADRSEHEGINSAHGLVHSPDSMNGGALSSIGRIANGHGELTSPGRSRETTAEMVGASKSALDRPLSPSLNPPVDSLNGADSERHQEADSLLDRQAGAAASGATRSDRVSQGMVRDQTSPSSAEAMATEQALAGEWWAELPAVSPSNEQSTIDQALVQLALAAQAPAPREGVVAPAGRMGKKEIASRESESLAAESLAAESIVGDVAEASHWQVIGASVATALLLGGAYGLERKQQREQAGQQRERLPGDG